MLSETKDSSLANNFSLNNKVRCRPPQNDGGREIKWPKGIVGLLGMTIMSITVIENNMS